MNHTPTPWHSKNGWAPSNQLRDRAPTRWIQIFGPDQAGESDFIWHLEANSWDAEACARVEGNADLIVRAVNNHAALVAALEFVLSNETHRMGSEYEKARTVLAAAKTQ